jgi:hypothetical protein
MNSYFRPDIIRLGEINFDPDAEDDADPIDFSIDSFIIHEDYFIGSKSNDIALIKLIETVDINQSYQIRPACLAQLEPENGDLVIVVS